MKSIPCFIFALWFTIHPDVSLGGSLSISKQNDPIQQTATAPPEPSGLGEPADSAVAPLEPLAFLHPTDGSTPISKHDGSILSAQATSPSERADEEETYETIADPLETVNRAFFHFNDKLYFWVLKPVASGYQVIVPEDARIGVRNFFSNLNRR